jgi:alpha-beta hydrolase superfamily lysophospholipase
MRHMIRLATVLGLSFLANSVMAQDGGPPASQVRYKTQTVDDISVFYREAGSPQRPTLVLLHGFPSSSHMFRDLIPKLAGKYHLIAADMPGYGYTEQASLDKFS